MIRTRAGPLQSLTGVFGAVETRMADAGKGRGNRSNFVHDLSGREMRLRVAHPIHDIGEDIRVGARSGDFHGFADALHAAFGVAEGAFFFGIAASREHNVGILCRFREEEFIHHQEFKVLEGLDDVMRVRVGAHRVFAENEESLYFALDHLGEAVRGIESFESR